MLPTRPSDEKEISRNDLREVVEIRALTEQLEFRVHEAVARLERIEEAQASTADERLIQVRQQLHVALAQLKRIRQGQARLARHPRVAQLVAVTENAVASADEPVLAFVHIPKTAGGTVTSMLSAAFSPRGLHKAGNYQRGGEKSERMLAKGTQGWRSWQRKGGRVTVGHIPYGSFAKHLPADTRFMTFLREPVDRVVSHYFRHIRRRDPSRAGVVKLHRNMRARADSLEEALVQMNLPQVNNLATRFLCGHASPFEELSASALDDAKRNLRNFAFVGIQERFEESLVLLNRMLGLGAVPYVNRHVSVPGGRPAVEELSYEQRALILERNQLDVHLYHFGLELFEEAVASADEGFAADVEALREQDPIAREAQWRDARFSE